MKPHPKSMFSLDQLQIWLLKSLSLSPSIALSKKSDWAKIRISCTFSELEGMVQMLKKKHQKQYCLNIMLNQISIFALLPPGNYHIAMEHVPFIDDAPSIEH